MLHWPGDFPKWRGAGTSWKIPSRFETWSVWRYVEIQRTPNFTISNQKSSQPVFLKRVVFQRAQKVNKYFGNFSKKLCHQNLLKIAQSGHTGLGEEGHSRCSVKYFWLKSAWATLQTRIPSFGFLSAGSSHRWTKRWLICYPHFKG